MNTESRYDVAILWCNHIDRKAGRDAVKDYLRDLKASHDALLVAGKMYMDRVSVDGESNYQLEAYHDLTTAFKAAEALR